MVKHYYQIAILALMFSAPAQAFKEPPLTRELPTEQTQAQPPRDKADTGKNTKKTEKKEEDRKQQAVKTANKQQDTFTPTEEISEDLAVSFPVDI
ncbi:hypothetical protein [Thalassomonas haliotis]|uniref:Uncharacterized protein n=1 Tax=Thalassomonas haliotis TaxID=485448 RepID=A0ABY7VI79_9GAMM|nr:hypothetical protein [Thalassomonas haliotis]WDE13200.1 hypothetical protein H3N35_07095 [Thalassomonas haliotis]